MVKSFAVKLGIRIWAPFAGCLHFLAITEDGAEWLERLFSKEVLVVKSLNGNKAPG